MIIKRLPAVEEMAGISILCSDKTGTLTLNQLTLVDPYLNPPFTNSDLLFNAYLASEAGANDPIEMGMHQFIYLKNNRQMIHYCIFSLQKWSSDENSTFSRK